MESRYKVLFALCFGQFAAGLMFLSVPPIMILIMEGLKISYFHASFLMSVYTGAAVLLAIPIGILSRRYSSKFMGTVSMILLILGGLIVVFAPSFLGVLTGRIIAGVGGVFISVLVLVVIPQWFSVEETGKAMGMLGSAFFGSSILTYATFGWLGSIYGWRSVFYICILLSMIAALLWHSMVRDGPRASSNGTLDIRNVLKKFELWKIGIVILLFGAALFGFQTWGPTLLERFKDLNVGHAGLLVSLLVIVATPLESVFGWISDKIHRRKVLIVAGCGMWALALFGLLSSTWVLITSIVVLGIGLALALPTLLSLPSEILDPEEAGIGISVLYACLNLGAAISQVAIGYVIGLTNQMLPSLAIMVVFSLAAGFLAALLRTR